jgi:hypothetical protein
VEKSDVSIRIFSLSLQSRAKKWYKDLPAASISDLNQFVKVFLDQWVIKRNPFLILEEYNHLKRHPGETVQQFSAKFNQVYNSMPADIRPPLGLALLHYPDAFDLEMEFQLRERNTKTLKEMKDSAISVEAHLLIKRSKLEAEDRKNKEKEHLTSSEVKLDILASTMEEMLHMISIREKLDVQRHHVPLITEKERVIVPKHFASHPWYHGLENDYFMYSIHNLVKDETQTQLAEEQPADMMCMFDDIYFMDDLPKYDKYDDDDTKVDSSNQSTTCCWEEEAQLQIKYDNHPLHNNHDKNEENATNLRVSERSMPLCFSSFQILRENYKQVVDSKDEECFDHSVEDVIDDMEVVLDPELQPLSYIDFQIPDESLEPETEYELMHYNSIPLTFNSFHFLKKNFNHVMDDKHTENQEFVLESIK